MRGRESRFITLLAVLLGLSLVVVACEREQAIDEAEQGTTEETVAVTDITLGRTVGPDKRITDETTTFRPGDTIYATVETEGVAPSATIAARWLYEDGQIVDESSRAIAPSGTEVTEFHVSKPDGWPTGDYEVVITIDGREVGRESFSVEAGV